MRILNLGAGVQSTTLFLMAHEGIIPQLDYAIFADTQDEPVAVYKHLAWLQTLVTAAKILTGTVGRIGDDLIQEKCPSHKNGTAAHHEYHKHRHASIPAYTLDGTKRGMMPRQCTKEYKIEVIERIIRREIMKLQPRQRMPKGTKITQLFGISWDERNRSIKIRCRLDKTHYSRAEFPLLDMQMTREDCKEWLKSRVPHETPRSACVFCPFKSPEEWQRTKDNEADWQRAVEVDAALRRDGAQAAAGMTSAIFVHPSRVPLPMVDLEADIARRAAKREKMNARERERLSMPLFEQAGCGDGLCGV